MEANRGWKMTGSLLMKTRPILPIRVRGNPDALREAGLAVALGGSAGPR
jgi:hypothetical protein